MINQPFLGLPHVFLQFGLLQFLQQRKPKTSLVTHDVRLLDWWGRRCHQQPTSVSPLGRCKKWDVSGHPGLHRPSWGAMSYQGGTSAVMWRATTLNRRTMEFSPNMVLQCSPHLYIFIGTSLGIYQYIIYPLRGCNPTLIQMLDVSLTNFSSG